MIRVSEAPGKLDIESSGVFSPIGLKLFVVPCLAWLLVSSLGLALWGSGVDELAVLSFIAIGFVCLASSLVGQAPVATVRAGAVEQLPGAMLASIVIRGGSTLAGVLVLIKLGMLNGPVAAVACGLWYAVMLAADVWAVSQYVAVMFPASRQTSGRAS
jgi:hypothetical protein